MINKELKGNNLARKRKKFKCISFMSVRIKFDKIKVNKSGLFFKMKKRINLQVHYVPFKT